MAIASAKARVASPAPPWPACRIGLPSSKDAVSAVAGVTRRLLVEALPLRGLHAGLGRRQEGGRQGAGSALAVAVSLTGSGSAVRAVALASRRPRWAAASVAQSRAAGLTTRGATRRRPWRRLAATPGLSVRTSGLERCRPGRSAASKSRAPVPRRVAAAAALDGGSARREAAFGCRALSGARMNPQPLAAQLDVTAATRTARGVSTTSRRSDVHAALTFEAAAMQFNCTPPSPRPAALCLRRPAGARVARSSSPCSTDYVDRSVWRNSARPRGPSPRADARHVGHRVAQPEVQAQQAQRSPSAARRPRLADAVSVACPTRPVGS